jgi:hypothetical protein
MALAGMGSLRHTQGRLFDCVTTPLRGAVTPLRMTEHRDITRKPRSLALLGMTTSLGMTSSLGMTTLGGRRGRFGILLRIVGGRGGLSALVGSCFGRERGFGFRRGGRACLRRFATARW